jgi:crotonobetainyl-CoA:carnitine CoA-transferase CaiB-like acyl-CoA transferase
VSGFEALQGIRILSLTQFLLGPSGVQYLSDLGADVVKVEPVTGAFERHWSGGNLRVNGESMFYMLGNRNARSVAVDLKSVEGRRVALALAREADVVVQNFRPGVADRLGLGYEAVRAVNSKIIYVSASGYGEEGPYRDLPGQDLLLQAMTGLAACTGTTETAPTPIGTAAVDQHGAAILAMGVLAALIRRERTGEGEHIEVIMARAALDLQLESMSYQLNGYPIDRNAACLGSAYHQAPYGIYETAEGHIVAISMSPLAGLAKALRNSELAAFSDPADVWTRKKEIANIVRSEMRTRTAREWERVLREHDVWAQRVNSCAETVEEQAILSLNPFETCRSGRVGKVTFLRSPLRFSGRDSATRQFPASLGQHTEEVLSELGYPEEEIAELAAGGFIRLAGNVESRRSSD